MQRHRGLACITGATSGIGEAFARRFASDGYNLVITGRRREKIQTLAKEISDKYGINVDVEIAELSDSTTLQTLANKLGEIKNLEILVNNAGFSVKEFFHGENFSIQEKMLKVHCLATMKLTHSVLSNMIANRRGAIINVSSLSAFSPFLTNAIYAATKRFVLMFSESLHLELKKTGVKVQALCPGITRTDFHERMGYDRKKVYKKKGLMKAMSAEEVVDISLKCLKKDRVVCIPGFHNRFITVLLKILPRSLTYRMALKVKKK
jgi:short-subunit dehydrogenase